MEYHKYYDEVFSWQQLDYKDLWLVFCIEAAWYCETFGVKYIRFSQLKSRCSNLFKRFSKRSTNLSSGSLDSILKSDRCKGLLRVRRNVGKNKNETRIYPNIPLIQKVVQFRKSENLGLRDRTLLRFRGSEDIVTRVRAPNPESVVVAEGIDTIVTKVRAPPTESVVVSEGIGVVVTRASRA